MILYVFAMQSELSEVTSITINEGDVLCLDDQHLILKTGVGKVNAAYALTKALITHQVEYIINLGFAGASKPFQVGDVVLVKQALYHDFDLTMFGYKKGQVPGLPVYFESNMELYNIVKHKLSNLLETKLYTGDMFMTESADESFLVDMEGAALYHVAHKHSIPIVSIKVVSDVLGSNNHLEKFVNFSNDEGPKIIRDIYHCL